MSLRSKSTMIVCLVLATAGWVAAGGGYEETFEQEYPLMAGGTVALENVNGDVSVEVWESGPGHRKRAPAARDLRPDR